MTLATHSHEHAGILGATKVQKNPTKTAKFQV